MINTLYENLAKIVIHYSLSVQEGQRVLIMGNDVARDLIQALYIEILKVGGRPFPLIYL
jgi:leucyl aminopeptidase (aminopeptidase T)